MLASYSRCFILITLVINMICAAAAAACVAIAIAIYIYPSKLRDVVAK